MSVSVRRDLLGRTETQLLLGDEVEVLEESGGWSCIRIPDQPAARMDPRGYPGWLPTRQLRRLDGSPPKAERLVCRRRTALHTAPAGPVAVAGVCYGTRLRVLGDAIDGWLPVGSLGHGRNLWVAAQAMATPDNPGGGAGLLAAADMFLGTPYLWGGLTPHGIDCSGLVHLIYRRYGVQVPRNSEDQQEQASPVPLGNERPGDLYFFTRGEEPAHHVGFVIRRGVMLDACYTAGRVTAHVLTDDRRRTLAAAGRFGG
ncbi:NlpC/P60 family protein [Streptomyces sp. NPDC005548]|uniref:C40 family peptidase n=1 Tax=Streptomyces sp. NPDC005548 TaxID=3364724 RepID=UPI003676DFB2